MRGPSKEIDSGKVRRLLTPHSITLSARASKVGGTSMPRACADHPIGVSQFTSGHLHLYHLCRMLSGSRRNDQIASAFRSGDLDHLTDRTN
jgi:hypothetical protein